MIALALDPFTPERPLKIAQQYVSLIHGVLEGRNDLNLEQVQRLQHALETVANGTVAEVRFDAERLMYLAERAAADGFAVHDQLIEIAAAHEAEIKRLGNDVIREYKALARKLQMPQRVSALLRGLIEDAEAFQDEWLTVVRQMRHRALAVSRRRTGAVNLVTAWELHVAALAEIAGEQDLPGLAEAAELRPRIAGDMIVYELDVPVGPDLAGDAGRLAGLANAVHDRVENAIPLLCGTLALRFIHSGQAVAAHDA
ncbi:hypothetical protein [Azospirillum sp. SYSU D00513]|uniref:hypothetical protein n=1 Tax=Azospirillum sp. SYSU D00513 TaxID=2812561 RepID=UPI001A95892F|nr:hypothetical protein [Azospirillum sp. SYSU D00513]